MATLRCLATNNRTNVRFIHNTQDRVDQAQGVGVLEVWAKMNIKDI